MTEIYWLIVGWALLIAAVLILFGSWTCLCILMGAWIQYRRQSDMAPPLPLTKDGWQDIGVTAPDDTLSPPESEEKMGAGQLQF